MPGNSWVLPRVILELPELKVSKQQWVCLQTDSRRIFYKVKIFRRHPPWLYFNFQNKWIKMDAIVWFPYTYAWLSRYRENIAYSLFWFFSLEVKQGPIPSDSVATPHKIKLTCSEVKEWRGIVDALKVLYMNYLQNITEYNYLVYNIDFVWLDSFSTSWYSEVTW